MLGFRQAAWHTRCDDEVSLHFNAFFLPFQLNLGVDRLSAWPILSILPIIDIGHFQNIFADNFFNFFL